MYEYNFCKGCEQTLPAIEFYADKTKTNGLRTKCKSCMSRDEQARHAANPELAKERNRKKSSDSYYRHLEVARERNRLKEQKRRQINGDRVRELEAAGRARNRLALRARAKARRSANLPKYKAIESANARLPRNRARLINQGMVRRAKKYGCQIFHVSVEEIIALYKQPCVICSATNQMHIDHIVPLSRKGSHCIGNLQSLCAPHNLSKGNKTMTEWRKDGIE